jgi:hypothetical protein
MRQNGTKQNRREGKRADENRPEGEQDRVE